MTPDEFARQLTEARRSGDFQQQIDLLLDILSYAQQTLNAAGEIESMRMLGNVYQELGDMEGAHKWRLEALRCAGQPDAQISDELRMELAGDLGRSAIEARDWGEAEDRTREALELGEQLGHPFGRCVYRINLLTVLDGLKRPEEAHRLAQETRPMVLELGDPYLIALYFLNASGVLLNEQRLNQALRHAWLARAFAAQLDAPVRDALSARADLVISAGYLSGSRLTGNADYAATAEQVLQRAASAAPEGGMSFAADLDRAFAQVYGQTGRIDLAITRARTELDHLERARHDFGYEDFQRSFYQAVQPDYDIAVTLMLRQEDVEGAFLATERARSRLLLAQLGRGPAVWADWTAAELQELKAAADAYGASATHAVATRHPVPALNEARNRFLDVYDAHRSLRPRWTGVLERSPVSAAEARALLGPDQALLAYFVTEETTVIFTITAAGLHFQHLAYSRREAEQDVRELRLAFAGVRDQKTRAPADTSRLEARLEQLYAILIAPVLAAVSSAAHWIIVPHGPLHAIPWAALRGDGRYLVEDHSVSLLPSVTFVASFTGGPSAQPATPALLIAGPGWDEATPQHPSADAEIDQVAGTLGSDRPPDLMSLRGPSATVEAYLNGAPGARLIHFACHSGFDGLAPLLSFLRLTGTNGTALTTPGCLYAYEIMGQASSATLVTLASCLSGSSVVETGDEQFGLVRAYLIAGAKSVLSAQEEVSGRASKELFSRFYPLARTEPLAVALARAQCELIKNPVFSSPVYWAPFVLTGAWHITLAAPAPQRSNQ
jgi:CHAT domain-containing protein